jgi:hypothetical protein
MMALMRMNAEGRELIRKAQINRAAVRKEEGEDHISSLISEELSPD